MNSIATKKIKLYRLEYSLDSTVTGVTEKQIDSLEHCLKATEVGDLWNRYQEIYYDYLPGFIELNKFIAHKNAKHTDILSSSFLSMNGLFPSKKFKEHLVGFKTGC